MILVRSTPGGHDAQVRRPRAIELLVLQLQLSHELDARVDLVCLEFKEA